MFKCSVHPGSVLEEELGELGISDTEFARQIDVSIDCIREIISGRRSVTGDLALRLGHWFKTSPEFWVNLQSQFDLAEAYRQNGTEIRHLPTKDAQAGLA